MLKVIKQDIMTVTEGIICHQVNCKGVMGAGLAKAIKEKYPSVFQQYKALCLTAMGPKSIILLGKCHVVPVSSTLMVANIFGQDEYGNHAVYTNYRAVREAFNSLKDYHKTLGGNVYVPMDMGCGLAGGCWDDYSKIIEEFIPNAIVCKI